MDDREFSSEQEYQAGVRADGRKPVLQSRKLYGGATKLYTDEPADFPFENRDPRQMTADELRYAVKRQELDDLDYARETAYEMIEIGRAAARRDSPAGDGRGSGEEGNNQPAEAAKPEVDTSTLAPSSDAPDAAPDPDTPDPRPSQGGLFGMREPRPFREPEIREPRLVNRQSKIEIPPSPLPPKDQPQDFSGETARAVLHPPRKRRPIDPAKFAHIKPGVGLAMAERGCKLLMAISPVRTKLALELIDMAMELETKQSFMWDRAHALIYATLLHMDEHWAELGFGSWMPFRYPDQWLSFCGIMTRVLAANGLIHAKHADVYRKLLDETPPVELKGTLDERIKESKTPHNIAQCKSNQGAYTMSELKARLQSEVWDPHDAREQRPADYWKKHAPKPADPP
jgi:hypothetical protein